MGRHLTNSGLILPVIRKVISRDDVYICSLCRSEYTSKVEANTCLNHCWYEVQELYPVVLRKLNGRHVVFRCHFCCRDYRDETDALNCARRCQGERNSLHIREQLLNDLPLEAPTPRPSRIRLVAMKPMAAKIPSKQKESGNETYEEDVSEVEIPDDAPSAPPRKSKADFPKQWIRLNEKYQCCYCKSLYYTKMETEGCFNHHFDEQGFEKKSA